MSIEIYDHSLDFEETNIEKKEKQRFFTFALISSLYKSSRFGWLSSKTSKKNYCWNQQWSKNSRHAAFHSILYFSIQSMENLGYKRLRQKKKILPKHLSGASISISKTLWLFTINKFL